MKRVLWMVLVVAAIGSVVVAKVDAGGTVGRRYAGVAAGMVYVANDIYVSGYGIMDVDPAFRVAGVVNVPVHKRLDLSLVLVRDEGNSDAGSGSIEGDWIKNRVGANARYHVAIDDGLELFISAGTAYVESRSVIPVSGVDHHVVSDDIWMFTSLGLECEFASDTTITPWLGHYESSDSLSTWNVGITLGHWFAERVGVEVGITAETESNSRLVVGNLLFAF